MINTIQLENMVNRLNEIYTEESKVQVVNGLADLFKDMGYGAISEEIRRNRKAKDNALYGLKMYRRDLTGDRINPVTNEVHKVPQGKLETINKFCDMVESIIETYLDNGNDKQNECLKLKGDYDNAMYLFHESMFKLNNFMDTMERNSESMKEYKELSSEYKYLDTQATEAKNKLDQFVLSNLMNN